MAHPMTTSQESRILALLQRGRCLSAIDCLRLIGCFRLAARVWHLRCQGHDIRARYVTSKGKRYAVYYLAAT